MKPINAILAGLFSLVLVVPANAEIPKPTEVPDLIKKLSSGDAKTRAEACKRIGYIGLVKASYVKDAHSALFGAAKDKDANVRIEAFKALAQVNADPTKLVPILVEALKAEDDKMKIAGANALQTMGPKGDGALPELRKIQGEIRKLDKAEQKKKRNLGRAVGDAMRAIGN